MKRIKIDELYLDRHHYLTDEDDCYFFGTYKANAGGYRAGEINQLISNFKKSIEVKDTDQWKYKLAAIEQIGDLLKDNMLPYIDINRSTLVPIPPSKAKCHVHFDNRMMFALEKASAQFSNVDRRELILCKESFQSSHLSGTSRPSKDTLKNNMEINEDEVEDLRDHIILFDDIITAGAHFKACKELIQERFPTKKITGVFIARRDWDA